MNTILTKIINRKSIINSNKVTTSYHNFMTEYESFENFVETVEMEADLIEWAEDLELINISFVNDATAVIVYRQLEI